MMREYHVQFCESLQGKFLWATHRNIYVKSENAGHRVMGGISKFIEEKLKLKVNAGKSAVARPSDRKFLGFSFTKEAIKKFKDRIREITKGIRRVSFVRLMSELKTYMTRWKSYFRIAGFKGIFKDLDGWVHRRIRCYGISIELAAKAASSRLGAWRLSTSQVMGRESPRGPTYPANEN
ncbi:MAG: hypothetical protein HQK52_23475 [Oligoflexia bacterium]|nr:hypothetical protein [Oligoflexia bacterium]